MIDVHVHTSPRHYKTLEQVLAASGISRFVNLSGGSPGEGLEKALEAARAYQGRIAVCANLRWREIGLRDFAARQVALLKQSRALGVRCLKISKALGLGVPDPRRPDALLSVDSPLLDPIWRAAGNLGMPIFIHTGDPKAFFEKNDQQNERRAELSRHPEWSFADPIYPRRNALLAARDRVVAKHRKTIFIGVHFANNPEDLKYVDRVLSQNPNLYVDIAARLPEIGRHPPQQVRNLFIKHQNRILFGTDLGFHGRSIMLGSVGYDRPRLIDIFLFYGVHLHWFESHARQMQHPTPIQGDWRIDGIGLPSDVLERVYFRNAAQLLWGEEAPSSIDFEALELAPGMVEFFP
jgi:predicted TIM-barrel fold metal-dependent hydrolase